MEYVAQAINKNTKLFVTCTKVDNLKDAYHYAKYYRGIGYNAKVYTEEEYLIALEENDKRRKDGINLMLYQKI